MGLLISIIFTVIGAFIAEDAFVGGLIGFGVSLVLWFFYKIISSASGSSRGGSSRRNDDSSYWPGFMGGSGCGGSGCGGGGGCGGGCGGGA